MIRVLTILAVGTVLVVSGCQTYTTGLQQSGDRVDETVAITALRNINSAQRMYSLSHEGNYGTLAQLSEAGYLDSRVSSDKPLRDYVFTLTVNPKSESAPDGSYSCLADPVAGGPGRHFYIDSISGTIHVNATQPASAADPVIE
jgi:competence protein ComGC